MDYRALMVSAVLATGIAGLCPCTRADIIASENGIAVRDPGVAAPARGMTMTQVSSKFGDPVTKVPAVGSPPISRWEYAGFVVYFERDHVIHTVVSGSTPVDSSPAAAGAAEPPASAAAPGAQAATEAPAAEATAPPAVQPTAGEPAAQPTASATTAAQSTAAAPAQAPVAQHVPAQAAAAEGPAPGAPADPDAHSTP